MISMDPPGHVHLRKLANKAFVPSKIKILVDRTYEEIGRAHVELQSLMRISYAVFCLKKNMTTFDQTTPHALLLHTRHSKKTPHLNTTIQSESYTTATSIHFNTS